MEESQALEILKDVYRCLVEERPINFEEFVCSGRL
jgi:hypothetical protein